MINHQKNGFFLAGSMVFAGLFAPNTFADSMPTTCEGIENCAVVTSTAELSAALSGAKSTIIIGGNFDLTADIHYTSDVSFYLGDYTITSNGWSLLQDNGVSNIYGGTGKIKEVGGQWAPIYMYGGTMTLHSGTIEVGSSSAGIYVDVDHGVPAELIIDGGTVTSSGKHGVFADHGGKVWLKSGTVNARRWPINLKKDADFVMGGGIVNATCTDIADMCYGIASNGSVDVANGTKVTLNGGTINSGYLGMYLPSIDGVTEINDGVTINGAYGGIEIRAGSLTIYGGTVAVDSSAPYAVTANGGGSTTTGAVIAISQHTTKQPINVTVSGGTFTGPKVISEANPQGNSDEDIAKVSISVTGGTFTGDVVSENKTGFITGGTFSVEPAADEIIPEHEAEQNTDGSWTIVPINVDWNGEFMEDCEDIEGHLCGWIDINESLIADRKSDLNIIVNNDDLVLTDGGEIVLAADFDVVDRNGNPVPITNNDLDVYLEIDEETYNKLSGYDKVYVVYFENGVEVERFEAELEKEEHPGYPTWYYVKFKTTHMSTYAIVGVNNPVAPETGVITRESGSAVAATVLTSVFVGLIVSVLTFTKLINSRWVRGE